MVHTCRPLNRAQKEIRLILIEPTAPGEDVTAPVKLRLDHYPLRSTHWTLEWKDFVSKLGRPIESNDRLTWRKQTRGSQLARYEWGDYFALSYTWGAVDEKHEVIINGEAYLVRQNLEACLRALRDSHKFPPKYRLWIDALCINQKDLMERGLEVERMHQIYSRAIDTLVWLGQGSQEITTAFDFIRANETIWEDAEILSDTVSKYLTTAEPNLWLYLVRLLDLNYWKRQWVLQEIAAGTDEMSIVYGESVTNWTTFWKTIWYFKVSRNDTIGRACTAAVEAFPIHKAELSKTLGNEFFFVEHASYTQNILRGPTIPATSETFTWTRPNHCANPRDKIYGLLGVMNPKLSRRIKPDYGADVTKVYRSFAKDWVEVEDLEILAHCDDKCDPTWVPRFNVNYPWYRHLHSAIEPAYHAHGGHPKSATISSNGLRLNTDAILVDQIDGMSTALLSIDFRGENALQPARAKRFFQSESDGNGYGSVEALREAIWRTSGGNRDLEGMIPAPLAYSSLLTDIATEDPRFSEWLMQNEDFQIAGRPFKQYIETATHQTRQMPEATDAVERFTRFAWSRRLATTKEGLVGFVPQQTERGDWMVVMPGCSFPVLMRRKVGQNEELFTVVAPCYMHGLMEGEVWKDIEGGKRQVSKITVV